MKPFHRHQWVEVTRHHVPPADRDLDVQGPNAAEVMRQALFGFTTVELRCRECGDIRSQTLIGAR